MAHHLLGRGLGVVDEHVQADHRVVATLQALEIGGQKADLAGLEAQLISAALCFLHHRSREVGGGDGARTQLGQRQGQAAHAAAGITEAAALKSALLLQPGQHVVHRLLVADADVALHPVDVVAVAVDAIPALKAGGFEVALHLEFFSLVGFQ